MIQVIGKDKERGFSLLWFFTPAPSFITPAGHVTKLRGLSPLLPVVRHLLWCQALLVVYVCSPVHLVVSGRISLVSVPGRIRPDTLFSSLWPSGHLIEEYTYSFLPDFRYLKTSSALLWCSTVQKRGVSNLPTWAQQTQTKFAIFALIGCFI